MRLIQKSHTLLLKLRIIIINKQFNSKTLKNKASNKHNLHNIIKIINNSKLALINFHNLLLYHNFHNKINFRYNNNLNKN